MRAGLSTIQQTMMPEAATVLNHSISEAGRRNHGQTTPLHVAATLLSSPSGFLRQACIRSHPNSSHPLQCRALELCFSVALERLPTAQNMSPGAEPPISNALMTALKRAQAHQRRGCPKQQQPLLAVKVELEQLIISILDDPSVSRVMREASFSSPAVKATIEQSMNSTSGNVNPSTIDIGIRPNPSPTRVPMPILKRNLYLNPRLHHGNLAQPGNQRNEEVKKVFDILLRNTKKRNPVLVGESEPEAVIKEALSRIEKGELGEGPLKNVQVIPIEKVLASEKTQIPAKLKELGGLIEGRIRDSNSGGIILDLGDLKWLVEQPVGIGVPGSGGVAQQVVWEIRVAAVAEMTKLLGRFGESNSGRIWLIGNATCETYLRCQVYHPSMENDWDLQAVPIASRSPLAGMFPSLGTNIGILSSSVESLNPLKSYSTATKPIPRRISENLEPVRKVTCCPQCSENYEQELAKLATMEFQNSSSENKTEAARPVLPQWLQNAKVLDSDTKTPNQSQAKDQELLFEKKSDELQKNWKDMCLQLHPGHHHSLGPEKFTPAALSVTGLGLYNPKLIARQPFQPKLQQTRNLRDTLELNSHQIPSQLSGYKLQETRNLGESLQFHPNQSASQPSDRASSPPCSPIGTDLVLGPTKVTENSPQKINDELVVKDFLGCISSEPQAKFNQLLNDKIANTLDVDSFKKLLKGLMEKAWWQLEAASAVATTVTQCKLGHGKWRGVGSKGTIWLLFTGPDRVGKKKMASVLSEHVCSASPVMICLGSRRDDEEFNLGFRGKTSLDRIADAVRRSPFSVIMLQDIDEADMVVHGSIRRAMKRGRLTDSHGREISLGNIIFILTGNWSTHNMQISANGGFLDENKLASVASCGWQLRLTMGEKRAKRRADWLHDNIGRQTRARKELGSGLRLDLNQATDTEDERTDGSNNSSDLTNDQEDEHGVDNRQFAITSVPHELVNSVDAAIVFKPANFEFIRREIEKTVTKTLFTVLDEKHSVIVQEEAIQKIIGGLWFGRTSLQEWAERVLVPTFHQLKSHLPSASHYSSEETVVVLSLESDTVSDTGNNEDWLPRKITVMVDGVRES